MSVAGVLLMALFARAAAQSPPAAAATPPRAVVLPPGNVEHGRYIAERVAMCVECHSGRDREGNIIDAERYQGASIPFIPPAWSQAWATRVPRNKGLAGYTDAMALRLLTEGSIGRDGTPLKPPMPRFRMTTQDAADVIAFMRSGS